MTRESITDRTEQREKWRKIQMNNIVVIDTETTWSDKVMSIGAVIADGSTYEQIDSRYYIIDPEYRSGGMYSRVLRLSGTPEAIVTSRKEATEELNQWFQELHVNTILAYNANFDKNHMPEFRSYKWCDIMRLAAYKQYNTRIPECADCCKTGRLKSNYGVEPIYRLLSDNCTYSEKHNAWYDAIDELQIVAMLGHKLDVYENAII